MRFDPGVTAGSPGSSPDGDTTDARQLTCLVVMHPVQNDFWGSVPARHHVARHLSISVSGQAKIQDLQVTKGRGRRKGRKEKRNPTGK